MQRQPLTLGSRPAAEILVLLTHAVGDNEQEIWPMGDSSTLKRCRSLDRSNGWGIRQPILIVPRRHPSIWCGCVRPLS
jgi:hypothetical protein